MFERLVYTSRVSEGVAIRDVYDIIRMSHNRNSTSGLTGALLFLDGYFIQILEGSPYALDERYQRILADPRHEDVELRLREYEVAPLFPTDWMALRSSEEIAPEIFGKHSYLPGLPKPFFDGEQIINFMLDCFAPIPEEAGVYRT